MPNSDMLYGAIVSNTSAIQAQTAAIKENTATITKQNRLIERQEALLATQTELLAALVLDFSQDNTTRIAAVSRAKATLEKLNYPTDTIDLLIGRCDL